MSTEIAGPSPVVSLPTAPVLEGTVPQVDFKDEDLALWLEKTSRGPQHVLVISNSTTSRIFKRLDASASWSIVGGGEFGPESLSASKTLLKQRRLWWAEVDAPLQQVDAVVAPSLSALKGQVSKWVKRADDLVGRQGDASAHTREEVAYLAAWRCQFSGCGKDLRTHLATGQRGRFSYFAHIVASAPDGPRGDPVLSAELADDVTNVMLLCDECHRLVDRVNPGLYTTEKLREMRERSIAEVKRILSALQYPNVEPIAVLGNISGQFPQFSDHDAEEALWSSKLRSGGGRPERFLTLGGLQHDPHSSGYWGSAFLSLKQDLPRLQGLLNGTRYGSSRPRLALFPLHGTSLLILAGRILGDASGTHLFQPHRNKVGDVTGTRWSWPTDSVAPASDKYKVRALKESGGRCREACLLVSLTFPIESSRLPVTCFDGAELLLPTIELSTEATNPGVVGHPSDLQLIGVALDEALRILQDEWHVEKIHLFVGAPTTACVLVGQKMQARNQATFLCHETGGGAKKDFKQTIEISSTHVRELASGQEISL